MKENEIKLAKALDNASLIITKDYLRSLDKCTLIAPREEDIDIDISECGKFYRLSKLVYDSKESFLDKLTTVVKVVSSIECSLATVIKSDGRNVEYYLGIISKNSRMDNDLHRNRRKSDAESFKGALHGNLTGSEMTELSSCEVENFRKQITSSNAKSIAGISGIVALRDDENKSLENYVQGIENLVDSLRNRKYTIVMVADPLNSGNIREMRTGYEMMYSQLSVYSKSVLTMNESDTDSYSKSKTESVTEGLSTGISYSQSHSASKGKTKGWSVGGGLSIIVASINAGYNQSKSEMTSDTRGTSTNRSESTNRTSGESRTSTLSNTKGKSLQLTYDNRTVKSLLDKIDKQIERLDECESYGAFDCAAYVIADDRDTALSAASNYNALMRGKSSSIQSSQINIWNKQEQTIPLSKYIGSFVHPRFYLDSDRNVVITPASVISGNELAIQIGLPKKSIPGVSVVPMAAFGRNIQCEKSESISIGNMYHMGTNDGDEKVSIDIDSLASHTFITGSTGSGKSSAIFTILEKLRKHKIRNSEEIIKFLVIEPAKGEYKNRFGNDPDVSVYGTNYLKTPILKINPFSFPKDVHVLEHIDRLIEIFNVCWPMYAAMPAVLKESIERAYKSAGWDLRMSKCKYESNDGVCIYPNFEDVLLQITKVVNESAYSSDSKGDYKGALCTRVRSLTNGLYSQIFTSDELSPEELFDENVIIDLSRIGSAETKSLIMGILIIKLQEYRMSSSLGMNQSLRHVTVLEEAHNILKKTSSEPSSETVNLAGKSVEMLANSIAEMRTYGEGFIIADQAPGLMDMSVIRNTNTKIILRLPDLGDRELVGRAANLNDEQTIELARLNTFVAAVYQNNWLEPVLCNMDISLGKHSTYKNPHKDIGLDDSKRIDLIKYVLNDSRNDVPNKNELINGIYFMPISADVKTAFIRFIQYGDKKEKNSLKSKIIYGLFNSNEILDSIRMNSCNVGDCYQEIANSLVPSIGEFTEKEIRTIIACIAFENHQRAGSRESKELFEKLMKDI